MTATICNNTCPHCGNVHAGKCPRIKVEEYYPDGTIKRVEFHALQPIVTSGLKDYQSEGLNRSPGVQGGRG